MPGPLLRVRLRLLGLGLGFRLRLGLGLRSATSASLKTARAPPATQEASFWRSPSCWPATWGRKRWSLGVLVRACRAIPRQSITRSTS